jgi:rod shape-determining protein MreD
MLPRAELLQPSRALRLKQRLRPPNLQPRRELPRRPNQHKPSQRLRHRPQPASRLLDNHPPDKLRPDNPPAKIVPTNVPITYTSGEQIEVYRFSVPVTVGVPLLALFLQAFLPRRFPFFSIFDLPLLVTIFFAMARRNPISGLFTGAVIGLAQDLLGGDPIGIFGIAKTIVGFGASSLGAKLDVENVGARFLVTLGFFLVHGAVYFTVARGMVSMTLHWSWARGVLAGLANAFLGVVLYWFLDKFKQRT